MLEPQYKNSDMFLPNIIISDSSREALQNIQKKFNSTILLDTRELSGDEIVDLEDIINTEDFSNYHINYNIETCINNWPINKFNYLKIPDQVLNEFFVQWVQANSSSFPENIMFDFGAVNENLLEDKINIVSRIIDALGSKNYIICSGAIPNTVPVKADANYNLRRLEVEIFNKIAKKGIGNYIFSDYSTVSPIASTSEKVIPIVQIKYTLDTEYWFVRNGQRRGNYNFVHVCEQIVENASTFDKNSCWADQYIYDVYSNGQNSGNPSVWASLGINKHIVKCINEYTYINN